MKTNKEYDICIIGAGIIGASIARELGQYNKKVVVLEANNRVGLETTSGNSGVIHGGFDPKPGKLNAKLNVEGKHRYEDWIRDMQFPYVRIDSTVLAFNDEEMVEVKKLYDQGITNGLDPSEMEIIDAVELQKREPRISKQAVGALICNSSLAIDPLELTKVLMENAIKNGVELKINHQVNSIEKNQDSFIIKTTNNDEIHAKVIINVAGHYADQISAMAGYPDFKTFTRRGQYRILEKGTGHDIHSILFMVPTIHGKGVIVAPLLDGHIMVGPTAEDNVEKQDTRVITQEQWDLIGDIGDKIIPDIELDRTVMSYSGSRPIEEKTNDFYIKPAIKDPAFINVGGIKSPGISSAPAIADMVIELAKPNFKTFEKNPNWDPIQKSLLPLE